MKSAEAVSSFKVVMLGNSGVGKTALVERISHSEFIQAHVPTVGAQYLSIDFTINRKKITLELWDTAGQEIFRSLVSFYARDAKGIFLVADITQESTMEDLQRWKEFIHDQAPDAHVILFGNKLDLKEDRRVKEEELDAFAKENNYMYAEGSAKTNENVEDCFTRMAEIVSTVVTQVQEPNVNLQSQKEQKGCC